MTSFRSRRTPAFLALSCAGAVLSPAAHAQTAEQNQPSLGRDVITYEDLDEEPGRRQASPKATRPVRDTPQTITILTNQQIEQQNLLTLHDVLTTVPGITFGAGEGGAGYGDSINFRGYSANTDITVDGVRDSAQYSRTDPFNLEQIEITNGANSVTSGAGSVGGSINIVTKRPQAEDRTTMSAGIGTDNYYRGTVDLNRRLNDFIAVRINGMVHHNDVPGRDVEDYDRWGIAPSITLGIESPTRLTLQYLHQKDDNIPQYGLPYYAAAGGLIAGVDRGAYYGYRNVDAQRSTVDQLTATFEHELSDTVSIRNLTRWQDVRQFTLVDPPQGTWCLSTGRTPTGASCAFPGYYQPSGPRGNTRDTRNQLAFNQVDLNAVFNTGFVEHTIDLGAAVTWEKFDLTTGNSLRKADGSAYYSSYPLMSIANPGEVVAGPSTSLAYGSNVYPGPVNFIPSARQAGELENYAVYLFDTMKFSDQLEFSAGLRYERNKGWYRADTVSTTAGTLGQVTTGTTFYNRENLFSYRFGLVYKPVEAVSLYLAYGNSETPSKTSVNGSCSAVTCNVKPEQARNYEIGAKAELLDGVLVTLAAFRNERNQYKVATGDPIVPEQQLDGKSRVDGISIGLNGQITPAWSIVANYTYLDSELIRSIARNSPPGTIDYGAGAQLQNTPRHSGSLFTTYTLPFGLTLGYGLTYQGKAAFNVPTATAPAVLHSDDYLIHNAFLSYAFTEKLSVQVNVKNVTDELYFTRIRNNGWATPGDARSAIATLNLTF